MNREIKFRAWLPDRGHFNRCNVHIDSGGLLFWQFGYNCDVIPIEEREKIIIQQYTGLKDKNGVEVYEGDIVVSRGTTFAGDKWEHKKVIEFNPSYGYGLLKSELLSEVIGNIYENPELLKREQS